VVFLIQKGAARFWQKHLNLQQMIAENRVEKDSNVIEGDLELKNEQLKQQQTPIDMWWNAYVVVFSPSDELFKQNNTSVGRLFASFQTFCKERKNIIEFKDYILLQLKKVRQTHEIYNIASHNSWDSRMIFGVRLVEDLQQEEEEEQISSKKQTSQKKLFSKPVDSVMKKKQVCTKWLCSEDGLPVDPEQGTVEIVVRPQIPPPLEQRTVEIVVRPPIPPPLSQQVRQMRLQQEEEEESENSDLEQYHEASDDVRSDDVRHIKSDGSDDDDELFKYPVPEGMSLLLWDNDFGLSYFLLDQATGRVFDRETQQYIGDYDKKTSSILCD
jgi:hypothetical protein